MYNVTLSEQSKCTSTDVLAPCLGNIASHHLSCWGSSSHVHVYTCLLNAIAGSKMSKGTAPAKLGI